MCIIALAAISFASVEAAIPVKIQQDTSKTVKKKTSKKGKKEKMKKDSTKM